MIPDTRDLAGEWIEANIPRNAKLLTDNYSHAPFNERDRYHIERLSPQEYKRCKIEKYDPCVICVLSGFRYERFLENPGDVPSVTEMYRRIMSEEKLLKEFQPPFKSYGFSNPVIRIYAINYDRHELSQVIAGLFCNELQGWPFRAI
jgi:hypothetical protein